MLCDRDPDRSRPVRRAQRTCHPIITAARDQADAIALALDAEAIAVIFYLVDPLRLVGYFGAVSRKTKIKSLKHAPEIGAGVQIASQICIARRNCRPVS